MPDDISQVLIGVAAVLGPVLVYFSSKRAQRDTTLQAVGAARVTETAQQLDTWKAIAERHEKDRNDARAQEAAARAELDTERQKRRDAEAKADDLLKERHELFADFSAARGALVGQVSLAATVFDRYSPDEEGGIEAGGPTHDAPENAPEVRELGA